MAFLSCTAHDNCLFIDFQKIIKSNNIEFLSDRWINVYLQESRRAFLFPDMTAGYFNKV